jgi:hypothetical protein
MRLPVKMDKGALLRGGLSGLFAALVLLQWASPAADSNQPQPQSKVKLRENTYFYRAYNRRDPFQSLIVGEFVSDKKMETVDISRVVLVGIVKGELDRFALLEDDKGFSYVLRVGDQVKNGAVVAIGDESMVARVTNFGLHLARGEEGEQQ